MDRLAIKALLREVAVLVTALAFLVAGNLVSRDHLFARAGLPGLAPTLCHGDLDTRPDTSGQHTAYLCNHCVACQATLASAALPGFGPRPGRLPIRIATTTPHQLATVPPDLPPATGPPLLG